MSQHFCSTIVSFCVCAYYRYVCTGVLFSYLIFTSSIMFVKTNSNSNIIYKVINFCILLSWTKADSENYVCWFLLLFYFNLVGAYSFWRRKKFSIPGHLTSSAIPHPTTPSTKRKIKFYSTHTKSYTTPFSQHNFSISNTHKLIKALALLLYC